MYTGLTGKVEIAVGNGQSKKVAYISGWSVDDTVELIDIPELGKRAKNKVAGHVGWTASADGTVDFGISGTEGHSALFKAMHGGKRVKCSFYLNNAVKFTGTGLIESLSVDLSAEDKGNISISMTGVDELKYPGADTQEQTPDQPVRRRVECEECDKDPDCSYCEGRGYFYTYENDDDNGID
ncbi:MAG: hypothetical protein FWC02_01635 [Firmicutes bacterium]|nr:hypothetical protein [Bacillota bacterium]